MVGRPGTKIAHETSVGPLPPGMHTPCPNPASARHSPVSDDSAYPTGRLLLQTTLYDTKATNFFLTSENRCAMAAIVELPPPAPSIPPKHMAHNATACPQCGTSVQLESRELDDAKRRIEALEAQVELLKEKATAAGMFAPGNPWLATTSKRRIFTDRTQWTSAPIMKTRSAAYNQRLGTRASFDPTHLTLSILRTKRLAQQPPTRQGSLVSRFSPLAAHRPTTLPRFLLHHHHQKIYPSQLLYL